ncbi:SirB2 family protein [Pontibacter sp. Tf4]|uniref:SirB2 family protein n=1 Tax=Pontibacter sp. Tf4 TaxID=2761620 RepID=UPI0016262E9A|nr:SirB2 family protein [Pontibacter sp. Tf4]MBB6609909.1 SirB2 family protein [Pontibacter sp. Tf4]
MPITAFLHTHVLVVVLFLLLLTYKVILLLLNKRGTLATVRNKTKVLEMIFGTLILVTGGWLLYNYSGGIPTWLALKVTLVLIAIPVAIVGLKRENKLLSVLALVVFMYSYGVAETDSLVMQKNQLQETFATATPETDASETGDVSLSESGVVHEEIVASLNETAMVNAQAVFVQQCATCHGQDGTKGTSGATNLAQSQLSLNDRKQVIANGRGLMPGFGKQLSEQELEELAAYTLTLKK